MLVPNWRELSRAERIHAIEAACALLHRRHMRYFYSAPAPSAQWKLRPVRVVVASCLRRRIHGKPRVP